ncbi:MAG: hypothetical protein JWM21_3409 [Acidobacteria bacterium]|nr:hypothetical protein [Acidobacteriota bacterium]
MIDTAYTAPQEVARLQRAALIVGIVGLLALGAGAFFEPLQFWRSYLVGYLLWAGIAIGALALLMLQHLTGGGWGLVIRRVLEAATRTLPLMLVLFIPILLGAHSIYSWTNAEVIAAHPALQEKVRYLNLTFFSVRAVIVFAIWLLLAFFLNRWSRQQDLTGDRALAKKMRVLSGPGMVLFVFTVTVAAIDWVMSLDPEWSSTIFGLLFVAAWSLSALAFSIALTAWLTKREPMAHVVAALHFHDLGKLLLALVMLWAYFSYSQFLIIWSGNLPEEIRWYLPRTHGTWGVIALVVVILHFALPFLFLLSRRFKRDPHKLVLVAVLILIMRYVDLLWVVAPNFPGTGFHLSWMDLVAPIGFGGVWLAAFSRQLRSRPLMPLNDPQLPSVLEQAHEHHESEDFIEEASA